MRVEVEVEAYEVMREIDDRELEEEVVRRRQKRRPAPSPTGELIAGIDEDLMEQALWHWRQGRAEDAIYYLEQSLGRQWFGLAEFGRRLAA